MRKRGPAPKPTAVRLLEGNPGRLKINENEPKPRSYETYEPPSDLSEDGVIIWKHLSKELGRMGLLTIIDLEPFHRYVKLLCEYREVDRLIQGKYMLPVRREDGSIKFMMQNPMLSIRNKMVAELNRAEQQFGMTPSARARMIGLIKGDNGAGKSEEDQDPYSV